MISISKDALDMTKFRELLLERQSGIIEDLTNPRIKLKDFQRFSKFEFIENGDDIEMVCELVMRDRDAIKYTLISVTDDNDLKFFNDGSIIVGDVYKSSSITIDDLIEFQVINESDVSYIVAHDEYSEYDKLIECQLIGIYNSYKELQMSNVLKLHKRIDVYVVKTNTELDIYFGQA